MADHDHGEDGSTTTKNLAAIVASTGVLGVIAAGYMAIANDARVALTVAEQHGQEILLLRGELNSLREEMRQRTSDRYTSRDQAAHEKYMEQRLKELEAAVNRCCK